MSTYSQDVVIRVRYIKHNKSLIKRIPTNRVLRFHRNKEAHIVFPQILPLGLDFLPDAEIDGDVGAHARRPLFPDVRLSDLDDSELRDRLGHARPAPKVHAFVLRSPAQTQDERIHYRSWRLWVFGNRKKGKKSYWQLTMDWVDWPHPRYLAGSRLCVIKRSVELILIVVWRGFFSGMWKGKVSRIIVIVFRVIFLQEMLYVMWIV